MGHYIIKIEDYYLEWSTIVDAPITFGMKLEDFVDYYAQWYGESSISGLDDRLARVEKNGTSSMIGKTLDELISGNRAGPDKSCLTKDELYQAWCLRKPIRGGWMVPAAGEKESGHDRPRE